MIMAAIWGIIKKSTNTINSINIEDLFKKMSASMSVFPFDRIDNAVCNTGFFACGHQYYSNEDFADISPVCDEKTHLVFCSDCFLYNRESLIKELNDTSLLNKGDSQIAYKAFIKWGYSFVEKLRGNFSFAIYDENHTSLHLFSDHFSKQYMAYSNQADYVCFSTTYKPILACIGNKTKINREFIVNSYRSVSPANFYKEGLTPFEKVYHLDYATHITINLTTGEEKKERYWNPLKNKKKLKYKSDEEYKTAFKSLFEKLTRSLLRSKDETGIMLSGGLDSSAVASFAAPILKERGKKLYSYTSVPSTGYVEKIHNPDLIIDETYLVEQQKEYYDNLVPHYIKGDDDSCISNIEAFQKLYNIPDKAPFNLINIVNMIKAAKKDNCSVVLSGENGNSTISYGYLHDYVSLNITKGHFIKACKEVSYTCKHYRISRKKYLKFTLKSIYEYLFKNPEDYENLLKEEDKKKYGLEHPAREAKHRLGTSSFASHRQRNNFLIMPNSFIQRGFYYTHWGLQLHFIELDPTMTVEMVEFCLSLPTDCFVHHGIERRLVRDYLKDQMPVIISDMKKPRGVQAVDIHYRVNREIDKYKDKILNNLDEPLLKDYLDNEKLDTLTKELKDAINAHNLDKGQTVDLTLIINLAEFLRAHS